MNKILNCFCFLGIAFCFYSNVFSAAVHVLSSHPSVSGDLPSYGDYPAASKRLTQREDSSGVRSFEERPIGSGIYHQVSSGLDVEQLNEKLKDRSVQYIVIDGRDDYDRPGDKIIQKNTSFILKWYENAKRTMSEDDIHKLVWLPHQKVLNMLMEGMSFVPEDWLLSMLTYYDSYKR